MHRLSWIWILGLIAVGGLTGVMIVNRAASADQRTLSEALTGLKPSIVEVGVSYYHPRINGLIVDVDSGQRSALVITEAEYLNQWPIKIRVGDQEYEGVLLGLDEQRNLAAVSICCGDFTAATFGDSDSLGLADAIYSIGYPDSYVLDEFLGLAWTDEPRDVDFSVRQGIVSALRRNADGVRHIESDVSTYANDSGSVWVNSDGQVIGMVNAPLSYHGTEQFTLALAGAEIQESWPQLTPDFGPNAGTLTVGADGQTVVTYIEGVDLSDFQVAATFPTPTRDDDEGFTPDYGFVVRSTDDSEVRVIVNLSGFNWRYYDPTWLMVRWDRGEPCCRVLATGTFDTYHGELGSQNHIRVRVVDNEADLWVNGGKKTYRSVSLGSLPEGGRIGVGSGFFHASEQSGWSAPFKHLMVWDLSAE